MQTEFKQMTGPEEDMRLAVGDEMVLNWEFDGFGDMYCYSDGKLYNNMGDFQCRSPAQIRIPDRRNHTFRVALQVYGLVLLGSGSGFRHTLGTGMV